MFSGNQSTSDLPEKIGAPARRALDSIGVLRLAQVTKFTEEQLLDLHGMGPKAMGILKAALAEKGRSLPKGKKTSVLG